MSDKKRTILIMFMTLVLVIGTLLSVYVAGFRSERRAYERAETVLLDSAREQSGTFAAALNGRLEVLKSLASFIELSGEYEPAAIEASLENVTKNASLSASSIDLVLPGGSETINEGDDFTVTDRGYFNKAMSGSPAMERVVSRSTGKVCVILAVPLYRSGEVTGVLRGVYYEEDLRSIITSQAYGGEGYSCLITSKGDVIVNVEEDSELIRESNIFDMLADAEFSEGDSLGELKADLAEGASAALHYSYEGSNRIAVIVPLAGEALPVNDWILFNIVEESSLTLEVAESRGDTLESLEIFVVFLAIAITLLVIVLIGYKKSRQRETEMSRQREEQFRIVTEQSGKFVLRYDIPTKTGYRSDPERDGLGGLAVSPNVCERVIARGLIDGASVGDYRSFYKRVEMGESPVEADILFIMPIDGRRWFRHTSTTIFNDRGAPKTAIISYYDVTDQRERELAYSKWQQELNSISLDNASLYEWNLTKDVNEARKGSLLVDGDELPTNSFDGCTEVFVKKYVFEDDRAQYGAMMNREHLIALYASGVNRCSTDYRYNNPDGTLSWRRISVQLVPYPDSRDIKAYVTNRDIDSKKREALEMIARSERDSLTGVLNRDTFITNVSRMLAESRSTSHALLMIDIDGFKAINDTLGHDAGDRALIEFVGRVRTVLRASDIIGRIGGDEFMAFLPDMPFDDAISRMSKRLCAALSWSFDDSISISASIGVAVYPRDGESFESLYKRADSALYHAKDTGKNKYSFYGDSGDIKPHLGSHPSGLE